MKSTSKEDLGRKKHQDTAFTIIRGVPKLPPTAQPIPWDVSNVPFFPFHAFLCFQGLLHNHGEVGHQHQGGSELAEQGPERLHPDAV